eukprot:Skav219703  [mRNA]  locus=scaffold5486:37341:39002:+ [translate_table: standard]
MSGLELSGDGDSSDGEWNFQPVPCERRGSLASATSATSASSAHGSATHSAGTALAPSPVKHKIEVVPQVARLVAQMRITNPEVLRVTRAHQAFENCASAFRAEERSLHHKSWKSERISRFWSHSWHGNAWAKVATLLVLYNGLASVLLGTCAALVMMCLFSFRLLPGFSRGVENAEEFLWSTWSVATGLVVSVTVFILWKPRQLVFFDRVCISEDPALKTAAIFSLAGMLKNSNEMLVLWDPTWSDRLWCLFELAAFLKCKKTDKEKVLIVRPTFVGPCSIAVFLTVCAAMLGLTTLPMPLGKGLVVLIPLLGLLIFGSLGGFFAVMAFRAYFHSVQLLEEKLLSKSFDSVRSSCCDMGHVGANGRPIVCDREVVEQCVTMWFGSIQAFEESIRSELLDVVTTELRQGVFTKGWALQVSTPILWALMDIAASQFSFGEWENAVENSVLGLLLWLICAPMLVDALILLTRRFCNTATGCGGPIFSDSLLKLAVMLVMILICGLMCAIYLTVRVCFNSSTGLIRAIAASGAFFSLYAVANATKNIYAICTRPARA